MKSGGSARYGMRFAELLRRLIERISASRWVEFFVPPPVPRHLRRRILTASLPGPFKRSLLAVATTYNNRRGELFQRLAMASVGVVVVSYPKCGRTWLRTMIGRAFQLHFGLDDVNPYKLRDLRRRDRRVPAVAFSHEGTDQPRTPAELDRSKRAYRNHKVVLLVRDPRDVVVSLYFHHVKRHHLYTGALADFVHEQSGGFATIVAFYNVWAQNRAIPKSLLVLRYEDLHQAPLPQLRQVLEFIGLSDVSEDTLRAAVAFASFGNMEQMESRDTLRSGALQPEDANDRESFKVRRGKVGGFADYLDATQIEALSRLMEAELAPMYGYGAHRRPQEESMMG